MSARRLCLLTAIGSMGLILGALGLVIVEYLHDGGAPAVDDDGRPV